MSDEFEKLWNRIKFFGLMLGTILIDSAFVALCALIHLAYHKYVIGNLEALAAPSDILVLYVFIGIKYLLDVVTFATVGVFVWQDFRGIVNELSEMLRPKPQLEEDRRALGTGGELEEVNDEFKPETKHPDDDRVPR
jgi:hypothetical protein